MTKDKLCRPSAKPEFTFADLRWDRTPTSAVAPKKKTLERPRAQIDYSTLFFLPYLAQILRDEQRGAGWVQRSQRQRPHGRVVGEQVDQGQD